MIKLVEIYTDGTRNRKNYSKHFLREIFVNPSDVSYFIEDYHMKRRLTDGMLDLDIDSRQGFTKLSLRSGLEVTIVGPPSVISEKLKKNNNLLKG